MSTFSQFYTSISFLLFIIVKKAKINVSRFEKRGNFAQKLAFHLSSACNSALFKLYYAFCWKLLAAYVSEEQVHESRAHTEIHFEKLPSKD